MTFNPTRYSPAVTARVRVGRRSCLHSKGWMAGIALPGGFHAAIAALN